MRHLPLALTLICACLAACAAPGPPPTAAAQPPPVPTASARPAPSVTPAAPTAPATTVPTLQAAATSTGLPLAYTVQPGDSLFGIALQYDVTVESLQIANDLEGEIIFPGQVLLIPSGTVAPPTPAVTPTRPTRLAVVSLETSPNPVERGEEVTVRWDVAEAVKVTLWPLAYERARDRWRRPTDELEDVVLADPAAFTEAAGEWTGTVPENARYAFRFELEALDVQGALITEASDVVELVCYPSIAGGGYCPHAPVTVPGVYQPFEHGYMLWRGDTRQILIIPANPAYYVPWLLEPGAPYVRSDGSPPAGRYLPTDRFARLWAAREVPLAGQAQATPEQPSLTVGDVLGWALQPAQEYDMTIQLDLDNTYSGILNDRLFVTLPDGRIVALTLAGGAGAVSGPAWAFVEP